MIREIAYLEVAVDVGESFEYFQDHPNIGIVISILLDIALNGFRGHADG